MRLSYNWLKDYLDLNSITPQKLAEDISSFGFPLESLTPIEGDFILDLEVNPNRGDCLSVIGLAREISAFYDLKLKNPEHTFNFQESEINQNIDVSIQNPEICPRFSARIVDNIEFKDSPEFIKKRLVAFGFRPINNIVDITNYVLVALGQPLHAFDYDRISKGKMEITEAQNGDTLTTLDGKERHFEGGEIIIKDDQKIYDLAGIMGGQNSEINPKTKTIILQSAIFNSSKIRFTANKLGLSTEASYRYERGVDFNGTLAALNMASFLIKESCPEAKLGPSIDFKAPQKEKVVNLDLAKGSQLLGSTINDQTAQELLQKLGFKNNGQNQYQVPSWRSNDINNTPDLVEEFARLYGFNKIQKQKLQPVSLRLKKERWQKTEALKNLLINAGFTEVTTYSFIGQRELDLYNLETDDLVTIENPITSEYQYLRPTLKMGLLSVVARNPWAPDMNIFEIGKVFNGKEETWQLGLATTKSADFINNILKSLSFKAEVESVEQEILDKYKIRRKLNLAFITLGDIEELQSEDYEELDTQYKDISKYPPTIRDLAFIVEDEVDALAIKNEILKNADDIFIVELFDEFQSDKLGINKKNLAYHIWFQNDKGPVIEDKVNQKIIEIIKNIEDKYKAVLRTT